MINIEMLQEMNELCSLYKSRWNKDVDYIGMPSNMSQERLLLILRYIVDTGDSVLVGSQKVRDILHEYHSYLDDLFSPSNERIENGHVFDKSCPLCGNKVTYTESGNSYSALRKNLCKFINCDKNVRQEWHPNSHSVFYSIQRIL